MGHVTCGRSPLVPSPDCSPFCYPLYRRTPNLPPCAVVYPPAVVKERKRPPAAHLYYWSHLRPRPAQKIVSFIPLAIPYIITPVSCWYAILDKPSVNTTSQPPFCFRRKTSSKISLSSARRCFLAARRCCFDSSVITGRGTLCSICTPGWNQHSNTVVKCHRSQRAIRISDCRCHDLQTDNHLAINTSLEYTSPRSGLAQRSTHCALKPAYTSRPCVVPRERRGSSNTTRLGSTTSPSFF